MTQNPTPVESHGLASEVQAIWEGNATFWDSKMGEGNQFHLELVAPATEKLLQLQPGEEVLELACGNGQFARRMAQLGARVLATDFSATFLERARERTTENVDRIEYRRVDAADAGQLRALQFLPDGSTRRFDAAVCNMALMDMVNIEPLFAVLSELLKPGGRFVFTIPHPSFNNSYCRHVAEQEDREGELVTVYAVKVTGYMQPSVDLGLGIIGQPQAHYYFHRPLSETLAVAFRNGLVLDGMEERAFDVPLEPSKPFSWANLKGIPASMSCRLRLPAC